MGQRECLLPLTKIFTIASGATSSIAITDSLGNELDITYCTLIDLSSTDTTTGWMRLAPGPPSDVGYYDNSVTSTGPTPGSNLQASAINHVNSVPGVLGVGGTALILSTQQSFSKVLVENALHTPESGSTGGSTIFALTYGHITHANKNKDQDRQYSDPIK